MSDLGSLSQCMLESDAERLNAGRSLRRKALTLSVVFEAALLAALVVGPLLFPGVLPNILARTPAPPYHKGFADVFVQSMSHSSPAPPNSARPTISLISQQPAEIPNHVHEGQLNNSAPASPSGDGLPGVPFGDPNGVEIPGVSGSQPPPALKPPAEKRNQPLKVSEGVMAAALITQVQPSYPSAARMMHLSGEVILHATIGKDGSVRELQVLSGNPILVQAAVSAVREWRYRPTLLNGEPVDVETTITVKFVLGSGE
jgi:protein TonB